MDFGTAFQPEIFAKFFAAFFALVNPAYAIPIFLGLTSGYSPDERRRTALVVTFTVIVTGLVALLVGEEILAFFSIDIAALRVGGGIIILGIALAMLREEASPGDARAAAEGSRRRGSIAVVPLAIPLTVGPGAIATAIIFANQLSDTAELVTLGTGVLVVAAILGVSLLLAEPIVRAVGSTAISVVTRIMAIILAAVAVEMIFTGTFDALEQRFPTLLAR
jgi:multiple antibiotic resistance protein